MRSVSTHAPSITLNQSQVITTLREEILSSFSMFVAIIVKN